MPGIVCHWIDAFVLDAMLEIFTTSPVNIQQPPKLPSCLTRPPIVLHLLDYLLLSTPSSNPPFNAIALLRDYNAYYCSHG